MSDHRQTSGPLSRRRLLAAGVLSVAAVAVAACSSQSASNAPAAAPTTGSAASAATAPAGPTSAPAATTTGASASSKVTISYWNDYGGANGKAMDDLLAQFQKETGVKIDQQRMNSTDIDAKIRVSNQSGQNPDLLMLNSFAIPSPAEAGILEEMDEKILADKGFVAKDFSPLAWGTPLYNGKRYGLPLDAVMYVMYLNDSVFKAAGLTGSDGKPQIPTDQSSLMSAAKKMSTGGNYGLSIGGPGAANIEYLLWQNDANVYTSDLAKSALDQPAAIEVGTWFGSLTTTEKVAPPIGTDDLKAFIVGKEGILIGGSWNVSGFDAAKIAYTPAVVPAIFKKPTTWADTHNYTLPKQPKLDNAKRNAAWQMMKWFQDHSPTWTLTGGVLGASLKAQTDPKVLANPALKVMAAMAPNWGFAQHTPKWAVWDVKAPPVLQAIYNGQTPAKDALTQLASALSQ